MPSLSSDEAIRLLHQIPSEVLSPAFRQKLVDKVTSLDAAGDVWLDGNGEPESLLGTAIGLKNPALVNSLIEAGCSLSPEAPKELMDPDTPAASSPLLPVCLAVQVLLYELERSDDQAISSAIEVLEVLVAKGADVLETDFVLLKSAWEEWLTELEQTVDVTDRMEDALKVSQLLLRAQGEETRAAFSEALVSGGSSLPDAVRVLQIPGLGGAWRARCKQEALERGLDPAPAPSRGPRL